MSDPPIESGRVAPDVAQELPGLAVRSVVVEASPGRSTPGLRERLAHLSGRFAGAQAIELRRQEVPHAYRVLFRHIGLDPDVVRTPVEGAILDRLIDGGFLSRDRVADACLIAVVETGVPVWAVDADTLSGPLTVRPAAAGERLGVGEHADEAPAGRLLVADDHGPVAVLFGDLVVDRLPGPETRRIRLFTVRPNGVAELYVEEALWGAAEAVSEE